MGFKPVQTKKFRKWLKRRGLVYKRTTASHEIWDYPDDSLWRPVTFRGAKNEIPGTHIHTNLQTLGITYAEFEKEIKEI